MATVWIVDGAYLMRSAPGRFDYAKLKKELEALNGAPFVDSFYLHATAGPATDAQDAFHSWLRLAPPAGPRMRVLLHGMKTLPCECPACHTRFERPVQQGVDVALATLMIRLAVQGRYDRVILSAGDGDFSSAVEYVRDDLGKEVWLAGIGGTVAPDLQSCADRVVWLGEMWAAIQR